MSNGKTNFLLYHLLEWHRQCHHILRSFFLLSFCVDFGQKCRLGACPPFVHVIYLFSTACQIKRTNAAHGKNKRTQAHTKGVEVNEKGNLYVIFGSILCLPSTPSGSNRLWVLLMLMTANGERDGDNVVSGWPLFVTCSIFGKLMLSDGRRFGESEETKLKRYTKQNRTWTGCSAVFLSPHRINKECWMKDNNFGYIYIHRSDIKPNDNTKTSSSINFDCGKRSVSIVILHSVVVHHFNVSGVPGVFAGEFNIHDCSVSGFAPWRLNERQTEASFRISSGIPWTLNIEDAKRLLRLLKRFSNHFVVIW